MTDPITAMLAERDWILADGAMGTTLFNMGLTSGDCPELWNIDHPDRVGAVHRDAIAAGCDLILTNSFGSNALRLALHDAADRVGALSAAAARIARSEADAAGRPVIVAGSMGPTGEIMAPVGSLGHDQAVAIFRDQAEGLRDGGADCLWVETISSAEEFRAASEAARLAGMPWVGTMSFDTAGRTMMGLSPADLTALVDRLDHPPIAFGANCGVGASDLLRTIVGLAAQGPERPIVAKGNAGIPKFVHCHIHYDGTPDLMARYATLARDCGARIIGGCCGTTPEHLSRMREALETEAPGQSPSLDTIAGALGPFAAPEAEPQADGRSDGRRRRARG